MSATGEERARIAGAAREAVNRRLAQSRERPSLVPRPRPVTDLGAAVGDRRALRFDELPSYVEAAQLKTVARLAGLSNPFFRLHEGHAGAQSRIEGREVINFASYDYCGLNADPRVAAAAKAAIDRFGVSPSGSRLVSGTRPVHLALEEAIARHYRAEAALCFVSGHSTNVSTIGHLMGEGDVILYDALCHNSILMGMKLSGAARRVFPHNDMAALESLLAECRGRYRNALIVTEGLFSMDGDLPPLAVLIALKRRFGAWLMVDEAHALGTVGQGGEGSFAALGIAPADVDIWMGTLSKTLASTGGYIAGSAALIEGLRDHASGFVYSVALAPALAAAAETALGLLQAEPARVEKLQRNAALFLRLARETGLNTGTAGPFGIVPVLVGDSLLAAKLSDLLLEQQVNVTPVMFPAVPMRAARLRFFLSALHSEEEIRTAVAVTAAGLERLRREGFGMALPPGLVGL
jgi:8-amino-7-oxononanoate synthase